MLEEKLKRLEPQQESPAPYKDRAERARAAVSGDSAYSSRPLLVSLIERVELTQDEQIHHQAPLSLRRRSFPSGSSFPISVTLCFPRGKARLGAFAGGAGKRRMKNGEAAFCTASPFSLYLRFQHRYMRLAGKILRRDPQKRHGGRYLLIQPGKILQRCNGPIGVPFRAIVHGHDDPR